MKKAAEKQKRAGWLRYLSGAAFLLMLVLGVMSSRTVSADTDAETTAEATTETAARRTYKDRMAEDAAKLSKSEMKTKYGLADSELHSAGYTTLTETITERTRVLRQLQGFYPFLSEKSQFPDLVYDSDNKWTFADDGITVDVASEKSAETAYYRMGTEETDNSITTWVHVDSEADYNYMMELAAKGGGVKILIGYQYDNQYDGTNLTHYISSGTDTVKINRTDWQSSNNADSLRTKRYVFDQFIGQTYVFNASAKTFDVSSCEAVPETMVTRTMPASFILHATSKDNCKLEMMDGLEGAGNYYCFYSFYDNGYTYGLLPYPYIDLTSNPWTTYGSVKNFRVEYNDVTKKCRIFAYTGDMRAHGHLYSAFTDDEYSVFSKYMYQYQVNYDYKDATDKYLTTKTSFTSRNWDLSPFWNMALGSFVTDSVKEIYNQHFYSALEDIVNKNLYYGDYDNGCEFYPLSTYVCLAGGELGWSFVGYPSIDKFQKDKYVWKSSDMQAKTATTLTTKNVNDDIDLAKITGKYCESTVEPNFNMWEDITYENFGNFFFEYGSFSAPDYYIMRMNPKTDYYAVSLDIWYGVDGIPIDVLTEGGGGKEAGNLSDNVLLEDALTTSSTLGTDIIVGKGSEDGSIYATKSNEVLYVPADKTIKIEEGGYFIVTGNSVVILQGKIENKGTIIVQPGGVITYLQYESEWNCGIYNQGGSMLVRDNAKVRVRYLTGSASGIIDESVLENYNEEGFERYQLVTYMIRNKNPGQNFAPTDLKSIFMIEGTVLVTQGMLIAKGTRVTVDGGALIGGDLSTADANRLFQMTDDEWAEEAVIYKSRFECPNDGSQYPSYSWTESDLKSNYTELLNGGIIKMGFYSIWNPPNYWYSSEEIQLQ